MKKFVLLVSLLVVLNCTTVKEPISETGSELGPIHRAETFFPLTVGNFWDYLETTYWSDSMSQIQYTARVNSRQQIGGFEWNEIVYTPESQLSPRYLMAENDSVYELQYNFTTPVRALQYFKPTQKIQQFHSLLGGDVSIIKTAYILEDLVTTPAGTFDKCYMFAYETPDWSEKEIVSEGVGIVQSEFVLRTLEGDTEFVRITQLKKYQVQ